MKVPPMPFNPMNGGFQQIPIQQFQPPPPPFQASITFQPVSQFQPPPVPTFQQHIQQQPPSNQQLPLKNQHYQPPTQPQIKSASFIQGDIALIWSDEDFSMVSFILLILLFDIVILGREEGNFTEISKYNNNISINI